MPSDTEETDPSEREQQALERDRRRLAQEVLNLQQTVQQQQRHQMAELAVDIDASFPKYHGDPTKDGSFKSFLNDYKMTCDRFGF
jgi:predicted unusual protein kinase regulating ubiquinone biosynthesis (AarF/ABC1/UbiB family)